MQNCEQCQKQLLIIEELKARISQLESINNIPAEYSNQSIIIHNQTQEEQKTAPKENGLQNATKKPRKPRAKKEVPLEVSNITIKVKKQRVKKQTAEIVEESKEIIEDSTQDIEESKQVINDSTEITEESTLIATEQIEQPIIANLQFKCPKCDRGFDTKKGLGSHNRFCKQQPSTLIV